MRLHANARLSVKGRELLVERLRAGWSLAEAAMAAGVSERTARGWRDRSRAEGAEGLLDRSSAPLSASSRSPEDRIAAIAALRRLRFTGAEIAELLGMARSTVSGILTRIGMGKLGRGGLEPPQRYERDRPGGLIHVDVKKLGRIQGGAGKRIAALRRGARPRRRDRDGVDRCVIGWEYVHVAIDDATRLAYAAVLSDEKATSAVGFLRRALAFYAGHGITVERVLTDNGSAYRSAIHSLACRALGVRHLRTRPYRPQTNGKNRTLHPHAARRLGLRRHLPLQPRTHGRPVRLAGPRQLPTTTRQPQPPAPGQSPTTIDREQRPRVLHLGRA
jgi:transcriptional regulator with XRE-family HTH domain